MIGSALAASVRNLGIAVLALVAAAMPASGQPSALRLLDVPYIEQSEALCGGAAAAMVMRYWGARDIRAESFAPLVDKAAGGIRGDDLLTELSGRGWDARSFRGDTELVAARLAAGQPVIALIEDRPGAYHYVVVVAWANGRVVFHDPARNPFQVVSASSFAQAWQKSGYWTLLLLPGAAIDRDHADASAATTVRVETPCDGLVSAGMRAAQQGDRPASFAAFQSAAELCPSSSAPHRELAGVHALEGQWAEAAVHARAAVSRDPTDQHAWRILATSAYVSGDADAALGAWNVIGEPSIEIVTIQGLVRTRHAAISPLLGLAAGDLLSPGSLKAAEHRLRELPSAEFGRLQYKPLGEGRASVEATVLERPLFPRSRGALAGAGVRAAVDRELRFDIVSLGSSGDVVGAAWRWWEQRPRLELSFAAPTRHGIVRAVAFGEEQAYAVEGSDLRERRSGAELSLANWTARQLRWEFGLALDSWGGRGRTASLQGAFDQRLWSDHLSLRASGRVSGGDFTAAGAALDLVARSRIRHEGTVAVASVGHALASDGSPFAWWDGAGSGHGRGALLRAHPLLDHGRISGEVFGRRLSHASAEVRRWSRPLRGLLRLAPALFVDAAHADERMLPGAAWHVDAGVGLRVAVPGGGVLRVDVGKGLRDGATAFSASVVR